MGLNPHLNNHHCIIPEDVYHFDRDLAATRFTLMKNALQFNRTVFLCAERLPLVLKDVVSRPNRFI